ncbi:1-deoxy-D-xylulose 5-phosphate reductoisomerase [Mycobacteroides abscessus subsp. abscessus]|nr:1-deoxy-D-xylulose 5-phosphate reductoisomerase [Mycobacteroides abscessus subsp. abscessus]
MSSEVCRVLLLGSTGSIGTQALEVIAANPERFEVVGLAAGGGNVELLRQQISETGVTNVAVADERAAVRLDIPVLSGPDAVTELVENTEADVVLNALVGALGLRPTLAALKSGARLALANKESLVAGGPLVTKAAAPGQIVPVDSEHSALAQCLRGGTRGEVAQLILTASGGPFRGWTAQQLTAVTPEQAGAHPTWSMGPMNTLNSASLVNKGLELIETHLLELVIDAINGAAEADTASGGVSIRELTGDIKRNSASGDLAVKVLRGHARVASASGSVDIGTAVAGGLVFETASGNTSIGIARGTAARLAIDTHAGAFTNSLEPAEGPDAADEIFDVNIRTAKGDIDLHRPVALAG